MLTGWTPSTRPGRPRSGQRSAAPDPQHRDLVAAGIDREQQAAVGRSLQRALGCQAAPSARSAGGERRAGHRCQRPVGVPVECGDRVRAGRVVVHVDVSHHRAGRRGCVAGADRGCCRERRQQADTQGSCSQLHASPSDRGLRLRGRPANVSKLGQGVLPTCVRAITRRETRDGSEACRRYALGMGGILVVDDEPVVRDVLSRYLTREGYTVSEAADGEQALSAIRSDPPQAVVLDLMLPRLSGLDVLSWCGWEGPAGHHPVRPRFRGGAHQRPAAGRDDYIVKPYSPREVVERVRAVLRRSDSRQMAAASATANWWWMVSGARCCCRGRSSTPRARSSRCCTCWHATRAAP